MDREDLIGGIRNNKGYQIKSKKAIPLINNLEIGSIFKDENKEKWDSVMDLILVVV